MQTKTVARTGLVVLAAVIAGGSAFATATPGASIRTRAVAYWYLPATDDAYARVKVEAVMYESPVQRSELTVIVTRDRCARTATDDVLRCPDRWRKTWATDDGTMDVPPDASRADLRFDLAGRTHHVEWSAPTQSGGWDTRGVCGSGGYGISLAAGVFRNMGSYEGRVFGRKLSGPVAGDDHAWIERGPALSTC